MWIPRSAFEELIHDRSQAQGRAHALESQIVAQRATMDWMVLRLTQLETERAQLIYKYMGVKITVPEMSVEPQDKTTVDAMLNDPGSLFKDMGDDAARKAGIDWNEEGEVVSV